MAFSDPNPSKSRSKEKRNRSQLHQQESSLGHHQQQQESPVPKKTKHSSTWANLDVILSLQRNDLDDRRKIELASEFVYSDVNLEYRGPQPISITRLASFLSDWIQSLLIPREKGSGLSGHCLNYKCWAVLRFCLKNSLVSVSLNLLKSVNQVFKFNADSSDGKILLDNVLECFELILSSNPRAFYNASMDVWKPCVVEIVGAVRKSSADDRCRHTGDTLSRLSHLLLEHFVNFLRFHKDPANVFSKFVDGLLEPLLELLVLLHMRTKEVKCGQVGSLLRLVEDVLSNGLFHPANIGGFLSLRSSSTEQKTWAPKGHREFFKKLGDIIMEKKVMTLWGFGYLFRLFVTSAKTHKKAYLSSKTGQTLPKSSETSDEHKETSKPLFEVFVQFMQPLLLECKRCSEKEFSELGEVSGDGLLEAHGILKSVNEILLSFIQEKIYIRTEDTSEGAHYSFLKEVYDSVVLISGKIYQLWLSKLDIHDYRGKKMITLAAREAVAAIGYFMEIEYKVVEDDLVTLWRIMFSFLAVHIAVEDTKLSSSLISDILNLGCKLINIYSELRQVNSPLFALCKAVRLFRNSGDGDVLDFAMFSWSSLSSNVYVKSVGTLICSQELQATVSNAIKSIPEGQASGCVQQLEVDVRDSLQWMRFTSLRDDGENLNETDNLNVGMTYLDMQTELLGRFLSEIYANVLDSLTVTCTNSISIGNSIKNLMETLGLSFSNLVQNQSGNVDEFIFSVTGRRLHDHEKPETDSGMWIRPLGISWVFVFFFRMYVSCRSLYRQLISLMPPVLSVKAAKSMGSFFTVAREGEWKDRLESMDEGYFSWIAKASISLLDLIKFHLEDFLSSTGCPTLLYVIYIMALQRLSDLNRLIKAFEFLQGRDTNKASEQWKRLIIVLKQEATELTNFLIRRGKLLDSEGLCTAVQNDEAGNAKPAYDDAWDLGVCSLNGRSLHTAIWMLLCRNVDVWCAHAAKKYLKKFLACLFYYSVQDVKCSGEVSMQSTKELSNQKITIHHASMEFLTNIVSYEQPTLRKHFTSGFGRVLERLLAPILSHGCANNTDLGSLPDWSEFLNILKKEPLIGLKDRIVSLDHSSLPNPNLVISNAQYMTFDEGQPSPPGLEFRMCESLLNTLSNIPKVNLDAKSFSIYTAYVLNLERLVVSNLLNKRSSSFIYNTHELLRLFISCRRVMKYLVLASLEDNSGAGDSYISAVFASSNSILWLLNSVSEIVELSHAFCGEKYSICMQDVIFPLIDHTSYIFLAISEMQMISIKGSLINDEKFHKEHPVEIMAEILKEQGRSLLDLLRGIHAIKLEDHVRVLSCSRLAVTLSCFQGFLWGLISSIDSMNEDISTSLFSRLKPACLPKLSECIIMYEDIVNLCFSRDDKPGGLCTSRNLLDVLTDCAYKLSFTEFKHYSGNHPRTNEQVVRVEGSGFNHDNDRNNPSGFDYDRNPLCEEQKVSSFDAVGVANAFNTVHKVDLLVLQNLKGSLLQSVLRGENPKIAFTLQQLFAASAAILKLKTMLWFPRSRGSKVQYSKLAESSIYVLETSEMILREMADMVGNLDPFSFVWLDGVLAFLEVVGSSNVDLNLSEDFYTQLIDTLLRAIGKCISLQGKSATLSSHETGSSTKMLQSHKLSTNDGVQLLDQVKCSINAFKARLRTAFKKLIRPTKFDLLTALQSLERALVGVQQGCNMVYEISTGNPDGGEVSSIVAAGIDCLELVLESLSGHNLVLGKILSFINALLNIILHLQNPAIFYLEKQASYNCEVKPDSGAVILMCVEILADIAGNDSFRMEPWHVSQCLHIPLALFNGFHQLKDSFVSYEISTIFDNQKVEPPGDLRRDIVDRKFSVELYASCCRLLCTTIKHQKRHTEHCIAMLEDSVSTLLNCLEIADTDTVRGKGYFCWKKEEAIKCASFLRRIYEEIRNQKDAFAEYTFYFLSNYICTYSGCGPLKTGIKREIDEALRPGVYSLIDVCSKADLQQLHTSLGEGVCRSTLKSLLHDYKVNFKYGGKI